VPAFRRQMQQSIIKTAAASTAQVSALVGGIVWLALFLLPLADVTGIRIIERLMLLGVLVIVPLGLSLVVTENDNKLVTHASRAAIIAQPCGALMALGSLLLQQGKLAGMLAAGWLIVCGLVALLGAARLFSRRTVQVEELSIDAGLLYLAIGGGWFVMSGVGAQPLGFGSTIVLLTAVHFHFAGFAAPILAGLAGRFLPVDAKWGRRLLLAASACIVGGTPMVAAGITFSPLVGLVGTIVVATGLLMLAVLVMGWVVPALDSLAPKILLTISAASSASAMALACAYAYSIVAQKLIISIPQMAQTHGIANALGFSLCGLVAWSLINSKPRAA
jgi:hypothetical protein